MVSFCSRLNSIVFTSRFPRPLKYFLMDCLDWWLNHWKMLLSLLLPSIITYWTLLAYDVPLRASIPMVLVLSWLVTIAAWKWKDADLLRGQVEELNTEREETEREHYDEQGSPHENGL